jgi:glycosyltransferase involved in cell wall biosynthesis
VSGRNRRYFETSGSPVRFVNCIVSNENIPLRITVQQSLLPILGLRLGLDVLFSPGNVCPLWGGFRRVLKINTLHHYTVPDMLGPTRTMYRRIAFARSAKCADRIIANTAATKDDICKWMGVPEDKISIVPEASYDFYESTAESECVQVCSRYGITGDYVLFVSNLYAYKNVETLIRAFAKLNQCSSTDYKLVVAGRDYNSYQAHLAQLAANLNVSSRVHFLGFVPPVDLPYFYSAARVFVYPSLMETFGKPLVEAMSCGVPIVASNTSSIPEVLGNAGILVNPLDEDEMCQAIYKAATDKSLRSDLIARGLQRARLYSWQTSAKETLDVIEGCVGAHS